MKTAKKVVLVLAAAGMAAGASAGSALATDNASARGGAANSPGVGSGNLVQIPVDVPVNATGNSANVVGLVNPVFGNSSHNF
ncbi:chaplin [Streptomyces daliensis]|uniref:Chaplin n=1 Tax=Streptomyces daliensis TaxID=299421 RepID=A0A8T4J4P5_9ACTN|nr:chaplin [Streptomyces daliensis]